MGQEYVSFHIELIKNYLKSNTKGELLLVPKINHYRITQLIKDENYDWLHKCYMDKGEKELWYPSYLRYKIIKILGTNK